MRPQVRVRKMRSPKNPRKHGRSTDGIRQVYHDPAIRAARRARDREAGLAGSSGHPEQESETR